jgi:aspartate ammonia-lyase
MGRTQLQDAVPMTLGQEFTAYATTVGEDIDRVNETVRLYREVNMGATAIGTGINTDPDHARVVVEELATISGRRMVLAVDLIEATSDCGDFVIFSGVLKRVAVKISKICSDLRLLSSGPRAGFGEINLPPMQPGSSITPGKVNPVFPEVVNQVAYQMIGNDLTVTFAAEAGQLQLNAFEPVITFNILQSMRIMTRAMTVLTERCITGITANEARCRALVTQSIGIVTALNPFIGYQNATRIAQQARRHRAGARGRPAERRRTGRDPCPREHDASAAHRAQGQRRDMIHALARKSADRCRPGGKARAGTFEVPRRRPLFCNQPTRRHPWN